MNNEFVIFTTGFLVGSVCACMIAFAVFMFVPMATI